MLLKTLTVGVLGSVLLISIFFKMAMPVSTLSQKARTDEVVQVAVDDPTIATARNRARATLPTFYKTMARPETGMQNFAVKVGLETPQGREFMWLSSPTIQGNQISGVVDNAPRHTTDYRAGQRVALPEASVVDWMYVEAGKMKGNFTACALASRFPEEERRKFEHEYRIDCSS